MAEVYCIVDQKIKLSDPTRKTQLQTPLAYNNSLAHCLRVTVSDDDGMDANLSGVGVSANMLKPDGLTTVGPITGTISGNVAQVILPQECYATPGRVKITMNLTTTKDEDPGTIETFSSSKQYTKGEKVVYSGVVYVFTVNHSAGSWNADHVQRSRLSFSRTVLWVEAYVERNATNTIIIPGSPVDDLTTAIGRALSAASTAETQAQLAAVAAENAASYTSAIAPTFSDLMATNPFVAFDAYAQHCWYNGALYVNNVDIDEAEAWNNAEHWDLVDISGELAWCVKKTDIVAAEDVLPYITGTT